MASNPGLRPGEHLGHAAARPEEQGDLLSVRSRLHLQDRAGGVGAGKPGLRPRRKRSTATTASTRSATGRSSMSIPTPGSVFDDIIIHSSNIGAAQIGMRLGGERYFQTIGKFGFGRRTGILLPAEENGILNPPQKWSGVSLAFLSFGYEIAVTPLQMAVAFNVLASGGFRVRPEILRGERPRAPRGRGSSPPASERAADRDPHRGRQPGHREEGRDRGPGDRRQDRDGPQGRSGEIRRELRFFLRRFFPGPRSAGDGVRDDRRARWACITAATWRLRFSRPSPKRSCCI